MTYEGILRGLIGLGIFRVRERPLWLRCHPSRRRYPPRSSAAMAPGRFRQSIPVSAQSVGRPGNATPFLAREQTAIRTRSSLAFSDLSAAARGATMAKSALPLLMLRAPAHIPISEGGSRTTTRADLERAQVWPEVPRRGQGGASRAGRAASAAQPEANSDGWIGHFRDHDAHSKIGARKASQTCAALTSSAPSQTLEAALRGSNDRAGNTIPTYCSHQQLRRFRPGEDLQPEDPGGLNFGYVVAPGSASLIVLGCLTTLLALHHAALLGVHAAPAGGSVPSARACSTASAQTTSGRSSSLKASPDLRGRKVPSSALNHTRTPVSW